MSKTSNPSTPEPQADLLLVNLVSRGYSMAEARKVLSSRKQEADSPAQPAPANQPSSKGGSAAPGGDESLL